jgi:RHS repeat-associated protein
VRSNNNLLVSNVYDHQSRRIAKNVFEITQSGTNAIRQFSFVYDSWNVISEKLLTSNFSLSTFYTWGLDLSGILQGAGGVGGLLAVNPGSSVYFPCFDANGNVTEYVDASGTIRAHYAFDAFGNTISQSGDLATIFTHRFSTKYFDAETGLYYYGFRYYAPHFGRWVNRDLINELGGENIYHFVFNNPFSWIDYMGLWGDGNKGGKGNPGDRGHSDFPGHDIFDYTEEDKGDTSPMKPKSVWRHFRSLSDSESDLVKAVCSCNKDEFQRKAHQMQDFFAHYGQGYRASTNLNYYKWAGSGHGKGSAGASSARAAGIGVVRPDSAIDYQDAYAAAVIRTQEWADRWNKCCCLNKEGSWIKTPGRSEPDCSEKAPDNPWGDKAPPATPESGYWHKGWDATSSAAAGAWNKAKGLF